MTAPGLRKIIHLDMDAFFAAIEQRDHPELRGRPVIIGGDPARHGVVSTCSYEARSYGVHSALPMKIALRRCPGGVFLEPNLRKYREVSHQIREIFTRYTPRVEPVSIDEAYLDVTENLLGERSATRLARRLQREIFETVGLTASAGVSYNKFLAKVASDWRKPAGLSVIPPEAAPAFLESLPVEKFHGIGQVTAEKLRTMNIRTGRELKALSREHLVRLFGKVGDYYYQIVRGIDPRPVEPEWARKSIGREVTLAPDLTELRDIRILARTLSRKVARLLEAQRLAGRTVTLKVRYPDFRTVTRSRSLPLPVADGAVIGEIAVALLARTEAGTQPVRLLGVTVSNFPEPENSEFPRQLEFDF